MILAIDPGTDQTAYVAWDGARIRAHGIVDNHTMLEGLRFKGRDQYELIAIEMIASYGMPVGREVFETCVWIGRFVEASHLVPHRMVYRRDVKLELCGSARAKDPNIRAALIDLVGPQGTKKAPGPTYGIRSDEWAALGVAVTVGKLPAIVEPEPQPRAEGGP